MVKVRWAGRRSDTERRQAVRQSLTAAGQLPLPTYELTNGSLGRQRFYAAVTDLGLTEMASDGWPTDARLGDVPGIVFRDDNEAVIRLADGAVAWVAVGGWASVKVAAASQDAAAMACAAFRELWPPAYLTPAEPDGRIPITFWTLGAFGPSPRMRKIESAAWGDIVGNYPADVRDEIQTVMSWFDGPEPEGQLLLWYGPPGTGKSWVLRALASEWAPWAEFNYITDPDAFFVTDPSYMIDVLLADSYATVERESGDLYLEQRADSKWRVLICEDTGELLSADAKENVGQGLSRLLNVVDGMIGQGLRVLAIITTNDAIEEMHPAVTRPGRCASMVEFGALNAAEASAFLGEPTDEGGTLAELYARRHAAAKAFPEDVTPLVGETAEEQVAALAAAPLPSVDDTDYARFGHDRSRRTPRP
jgi:hypothetical protein